MSAGINAMRSVLDRITKRLPNRNKIISVVHMNVDGSVDFPENCGPGVLLVPAEMSESEWELQNAFDDQKVRSSLSSSTNSSN